MRVPVPVLAALILLSSPPRVGAWPIYVSVHADGADRLLRIDSAAPDVTDVTVENVRTSDMVVDSDGTIVAAVPEGAGTRIVRWDVESGTARDIATGLSRFVSLARGGGVIFFTDGWYGVRTLRPDGSVVSVLDDPAPSSSLPGNRYDGLTWVERGPLAGSLIVSRRRVDCEAPALLRLPAPLDASVPAEILPLPGATGDICWAGGATVALSQMSACGGLTNLSVVDWTSGSTDEIALGIWPGLDEKIDLDDEGLVVRGSNGEAGGAPALLIDRIDATGGGQQVVLWLGDARFHSLAADARTPLERLGCDAEPRTHGDYVSCVAHRTKELVRAGRMDAATRADLIAEAAQSELGKER